MTQQLVFSHAGASVRAITTLGLVLTVGACVITVAVVGLLAYALFHRRSETEGILHGGERKARRWILVGSGTSVAILLATFIYSLVVVGSYTEGIDLAAMTLRITGYRYWWKVEYLDDAGATDFVTANEIRIPVGVPVRLELEAADVIHSFWVPQLAGKIDLVPGQTNSMWIQADTPARNVGQCAEYCGASHANMRIVVISETPEAVGQWAARQRTSATAEGSGEELFQSSGCAACHAIAGTSAEGTAGPDLTHFASRTTLAAGLLPNTAVHLSDWLSNPDSVKPGVLMPDARLSPTERTTLVTYLRSLR